MKKVFKPPTSKIFGFTNKYSQSFLDDLAKACGFKWTKVLFKTIDSKDIPVKPLDPPSGILYYFDAKYNNQENEE